MRDNERCCGTCRYHHHETIDDGWICCNPDSENRADWTNEDDTCGYWENKDIEIWKAIDGFEGIYEVSNFGRVRSLDRNVKCRNNYLRFCKGNILIPRRTTNTPYYYVVLKNGKHSERASIHRLVARTFIDNPNNKTEVNHIDGNPKNNRVSNLEWVTRGENLKHSYIVCNRQNNFTKNKKSVICVETNDIYGSIKIASKNTGINKTSIANAVRGYYKTAGGYHWKAFECEEWEER